MLRRRARRSRLAASIAASLAACATAFLGCAGHGTTTPPATDTESQSLAADGTDTSAAEGDAVSLTGTLLSSSGATLGLASVDTGGGLALQNVGAGARLFFAPLGCLTTTNPTADSVTYTFDGCTGPRGVARLTGVVDVTFASSPGALTLTLASKGLEVNRAVIDWNATATITASGAMRTMDFKGHFTGTTRGGLAITRDNTKTMTWTVGDSCFQIDGVSEGTIGARDIRTELIGYRRCKVSCPDPGSEIKITHVSAGKSVDIVYGTGDATFTNAKGQSTTFVPLCAQ